MPTITACLALDHMRLGRLFEEIVPADRRDDRQEIERRFEEFARHLRDHTQFEEDFMFPLLERMLCRAEGPVCVLRRDHREIEDRLCAMAAALYLQDLRAFHDEHQALRELLENHNGREERVLYPALDRFFDAAARDRLVEEIRLRL